MTPTVYNLSLLTGLVSIGAGVAMINVPAALVTVGSLIIGLTLFGVAMSRKG
jgi:hypothetical protein